MHTCYSYIIIYIYIYYKQIGKLTLTIALINKQEPYKGLLLNEGIDWDRHIIIMIILRTGDGGAS